MEWYWWILIGLIAVAILFALLLWAAFRALRKGFDDYYE